MRVKELGSGGTCRPRLEKFLLQQFLLVFGGLAAFVGQDALGRRRTGYFAGAAPRFFPCAVLLPVSFSGHGEYECWIGGSVWESNGQYKSTSPMDWWRCNPRDGQTVQVWHQTFRKMGCRNKKHASLPLYTLSDSFDVFGEIRPIRFYFAQPLFDRTRL